MDGIAVEAEREVAGRLLDAAKDAEPPSSGARAASAYALPTGVEPCR